MLIKWFQMIQTWIIFRMNPFSKGTCQLHRSWTHLPKQSSWWLRSVAEPSHSAKYICFQVLTTIAPKANRKCAYQSTNTWYIHIFAARVLAGARWASTLCWSCRISWITLDHPQSSEQAPMQKNVRYTSSSPSIHYTRPSPLSRFLIFLMAFGGLETLLSWSLFLR